MNKAELITNRQLPLPGNQEYLWRYMDLHKFLGFLRNGRVRFSRMDQFEDPLEGIPLSALALYEQKVNLNLVHGKSLSELILDKNIFNRLTTPLQKKLNAIHAIQKTTFVTCWFYEQRESVAMWNLYSNADGIAVKIPFAALAKKLLVKMPPHTVSAYYAGRVDYQDFKEVDPYTGNTGLQVQKVALRKDRSFSHEKEFRFVLRVNDHHNELTGIDSDPLPLTKLKMKVVCHPKMANWKKENIKAMLNDSGLKSAYQDSEIRLRTS